MRDLPAIGVADVPDPLPDDWTVLDVREPEEWHHGHIEDAMHVPLRQLPLRLDELPEGRLVVVCKIGGRSGQAVAYLSRLGHDAVNLDGGMVEWASHGRPMLAEHGGRPRVV